jgi:1,4-alpha-glucan branching enzyme
VWVPVRGLPKKRSPLTTISLKRNFQSVQLVLNQNDLSGMSNEKAAKQKVTFSYSAPTAQEVLLAGDFTGWAQAPLALKKQKGGLWKRTISLPPGSYEYRLLVDGEWRDDPQCPNHRPNQFGGENCVCIVNGA